MRRTFPVVLFPTDLSESGNAALPVAWKLAAPGGTLHVLLVLEDPPEGAPADAAERARRQSAEEKEARARLAALVPAGAAEGVRAHFHVLRGADVAGVIEQQARAYGASVVVMSTHGRTGLRRLLLGSVASDVAKRTDLAVVLVRPGEGDAAP
jgi:nucleotide-binding universal stress UspA family protein